MHASTCGRKEDIINQEKRGKWFTRNTQRQQQHTHEDSAAPGSTQCTGQKLLNFACVEDSSPYRGQERTEKGREGTGWGEESREGLKREGREGLNREDRRGWKGRGEEERRGKRREGKGCYLFSRGRNALDPTACNHFFPSVLLLRPAAPRIPPAPRLGDPLSCFSRFGRGSRYISLLLPQFSLIFNLQIFLTCINKRGKNNHTDDSLINQIIMNFLSFQHT